MKYKCEWQGANIELKNTLTRVELKVDGKTQDFYDGLVIPRGGCELNAKTSDGHNIKAVIKMGLVAMKVQFLYDNKEIKKYGF